MIVLAFGLVIVLAFGLDVMSSPLPWMSSMSDSLRVALDLASTSSLLVSAKVVV